MDVETRKILFVQEFLRLENESIIENLEKLLRKGKSDLFEKNLTPMSIEQYYAEMDEALEDSENNRFINAKDLRDKIKKWG